ncbi:hypothetical protein O7600_28320 [Micromonospora sp. WMMA1998]|uniref:hypothetical protein n=1 Tax=Micromonospora sp. WMMA1998 TaxID=3015167 RepID=UPI00248BFE93|nr:hypothetical protein [Micromonospora sp. WMMA1998]WBC14920.1 hypothetical protein O7600_28320 [Micromonospora sp. WMMA1998]
MRTTDVPGSGGPVSRRRPGHPGLGGAHPQSIDRCLSNQAVGYFGGPPSYLGRLGAEETAAGWRIGGVLPARLEPEAQRRLPDLSRGDGLWSSTSGGDRPVSGDPPCRPRTDGNPFDRVEYLRFLARRS